MKEVKPSKKPLAIYYAIVLLVLLVINLVVMPWLAERQVQEVDYGTFMSMTEQENIGKVDIQSNQIIFTDKDNKQIYKTGLMNDPGLTERLYDAGAQFSSEIVEQGSPVLSFLLWFVLPILLFSFIGNQMNKKLMEKAGGGPGSMMFGGAGKSNAKVPNSWRKAQTMKCDKHTMLLYAVTDRAWVGEQTLYQQVESALKGGATCVQLREKQLGDADFLQEAIQIHALCQQYGVPLFINDNVEVALQCHAEGIHVGQDDMAVAQVRQRVGDGVMIGVSAHTVQEALDAVAHGADYLGVGAVFATHTKTDVSEMPRQTLLDICNAVDVPVVAIGGIHKENILQLKGTGVDGVALVSAIFAAKDIEAECRELRVLSEQIIK